MPSWHPNNKNYNNNINTNINSNQNTSRLRHSVINLRRFDVFMWPFSLGMPFATVNTLNNEAIGHDCSRFFDDPPARAQMQRRWQQKWNKQTRKMDNIFSVTENHFLFHL